MNYNKAQFEAAFGTLRQLPPSDKKEVAFAGRSSVGKSSLFNKIFNRKSLARVSSVPGKTITVNFYAVDTNRLVDLPGYGYAKAAPGEKRRWAELMEGYFKTGRDIRLVVQLIDMRHKPSEDDMTMLAFLREMGYPFVIALTKCDKLNKTQYRQRLEAQETELAAYTDITKIPCSAVNGTGVEELKRIIDAACE
ncbi:MAG: YihA family ribosome biogenesis GTP-binding protein [Clostridia bacterium]|nr:YihA family ribosome biogenesis GTP-binding protein [Clostridia bacterium]